MKNKEKTGIFTVIFHEGRDVVTIHVRESRFDRIVGRIIAKLGYASISDPEGLFSILEMEDAFESELSKILDRESHERKDA